MLVISVNKLKINFMFQIIKLHNIDDKDKFGGLDSNSEFKKNQEPENKLPEDENVEEKETVMDKIKDALQDWSNDNERDIQEDDSTPLRSGL